MKTIALTALLATMGALNAFCADMVIPTLVVLAKDLPATPEQAQQTISLFFLACAFMSLWHGALSDAYGRRRAILVALGVIALSAIACVFVGNIEQLWGLRVLQGLAAGSGLVISRAIVFDLHSGPAAQQLLSRILLIQTIAPVLTPLLGGWLSFSLGWRSVFACIGLIATLLGFTYWRWLPETLALDRRKPLQALRLLHSYREVLSCASFMRLSLTHTANWGCMAAYFSAAPVFIMRHLGRDETQVFLLFAAIMFGVMLGSWLFPRILRSLGHSATLGLGYAIFALAVFGNLAVCWWVPGGLIHLAPLFVYSIGIAITSPVLIGRALDRMAHFPGIASSCQVFLQFAGMALTVGLLVPLLWGSLFSLALGMGCLTLLGGLTLLWEIRADARVPPIHGG